MQSASSISSEAELLQLRNEGKISEAEYQDLLAAMRKPSPNGDEDAAPDIDKAKSKRKLGKIAFVLMFVGIIFPLVALAGLALGAFAAAGEPVEVSVKLVESQGSPITTKDAAELQKDIGQGAVQARATQVRAASRGKRMWMYLATGSCFVLGLVFGIAAFVLGMISWPDAYGKATVTSIASIAVIAVLARLFVF